MSGPGLHWINAGDPPYAFPGIERALTEPDGLLAAGGDLSTERLLYAYAHGIFPWYEVGQPVLWWSPDPRCVIYPDELHLSRRNRRALRQASLTITFNREFDTVVAACGAPRPGQHGTWITPDMRSAFSRLHELGWAHSIEVRDSGTLVGGLYGLAIGRVFFGESMFSAIDNASKAAMHAVCRITSEAGFQVLDCQVVSAHLLSLGATTVSRQNFAAILDDCCSKASKFADWPKGQISLDGLLE